MASKSDTDSDSSLRSSGSLGQAIRKLAQKSEMAETPEPSQPKGITALLQGTTFLAARNQKRLSQGPLITSPKTDDECLMNKAAVGLRSLEKQIIRQVEFYFGDYNLPKDRYMKEVMNDSDGWFPMSVLMTFPRLSSLSNDPEFILNTLRKSSQELIEIHPANDRIRRNLNRPCEPMTDDAKLAVEARTVYVGGFPKDTTLDELLNFFEVEFNNVVHVKRRLQRLTESQDSKGKSINNNHCDEDAYSRFLGSAFVTFGTCEAAENFLAQKVEFKGRGLVIKWQKDFFNEKTRYNDTFEKSTIHRTVWVYGFDRQSMNQEDLADFFSQFHGAQTITKRKVREKNEDSWKFIGSVFVTFDTEAGAKVFLALNDLSFRGDALKTKGQLQFYQDKKIFSKQIREMRQENEG